MRLEVSFAMRELLVQSFDHRVLLFDMLRLLLKLSRNFGISGRARLAVRQRMGNGCRWGSRGVEL